MRKDKVEMKIWKVASKHQIWAKEPTGDKEHGILMGYCRRRMHLHLLSNTHITSWAIGGGVAGGVVSSIIGESGQLRERISS